jgi:nitronate monooxygenase
MPISTRLTALLGITHPVICAPMALAAGGKLAAAVSHAGGLGLIGGGYGDAAWLDEQLAAAGNARIGCGFITWSLRKQPALLGHVLSHKPAAIFLSFDDPAPFVAEIKATGTVLMLQVQTLRDAVAALDLGADVIVAQGAEAGGHGEKRGTMALVPEVADLIAQRSPSTLLCAAGGIGDGRGLAAALMLGADGVVVGSRFWAAQEALVHPNMHAAAVAATGDDSLRTSVTDIARRLDWPDRYNIRVLRNDFTARWHGRENELRAVAESEARAYANAYAEGDARIATPIAGEVAGLIHGIDPASAIVERMVVQAEVLLSTAPSQVRRDG